MLPDPPGSPRLLFNSAASAGQIFTNAGPATPYALDANSNNVIDATEGWANPDLVSADCLWRRWQIWLCQRPAHRSGPAVSDGRGYDTSPTLADDDNVVNFAQNARLGDAKP